MSKDANEQGHQDEFHDAFALAGNEIRMQIIKELGDAQGSRGPPATLSFADLRSRVKPRMDSSRFNYHLQQLVDHFVASVDEGYRLTSGGTTLYRSIRAGSFASHESLSPTKLGSDCHFCDGSLEALYDDGRFTVRCADCTHTYQRQTIPPQAVDDGITDALVRRADQYQRHQLLAASRGVCPVCVNELGTRFLPAEEVTMVGDTTEHVTVFVHASCDHCGHQHYMLVGSLLLYHPTLVSFCYERGLDVTAIPVWELEFATTDRYLEVRSRDPWRIVFNLSIEGDELELVVDESLDVFEI